MTQLKAILPIRAAVLESFMLATPQIVELFDRFLHETTSQLADDPEILLPELGCRNYIQTIVQIEAERTI